MNALNFFVDSSTMGTILILVVYFLSNLALPFYYRKYRPQEFNVLKHAVLPVLGMIAVGVPMYYLVKPGQAVAAQLVPVRGARRDRRVRRLRRLGEPPRPGTWRPGRLDHRRRVAGRRLPGRALPGRERLPSGKRHHSFRTSCKGRQPMTANPHPLDPATAGEYLAGREIMAAAGLLADPVRFAYYGLEEPPKDEVLGSAAQPGPVRPAAAGLPAQPQDRRVHRRRGVAHRSAAWSARARSTPRAEGQLPIVDSEYHLVEEIMAADPDWQAAMARRGLTDMSKIRIAPITAGAFRAPAEDDERRMVRVLALPPGTRARPGLGAPGRRRHRARGPDREEGAAGHRRVRAAGARGIRRLRRPGRARA